VALSGAVAVFADSSRAPVGQSEAELAAGAGAFLSSFLGRPTPVLYGFQIHSALTYLYAPEGPPLEPTTLVGRCDGLLTGEPGVALQVRNADCLPVALAGGGAAAMVHAGWRGLAGDILGRVVSRLSGELGVGPEQLTAAIGVGVGPCHYPVGAEVVAALDRFGIDRALWLAGDRVDLAAWAQARLAARGVPGHSVRLLGRCTACSPRYHSYRRDGDRAGRQWGAVVLTPVGS
jgi:polyphenol oxidase